MSNDLLIMMFRAYLHRLELYTRPIWTCSLSGRTSLTFYEAWESEQRTNRSLEAFPEVWKAFILALVQHSTETAEQIAQRAVEFTRTHYTVGEEVKVDLDSEMYIGRIKTAIYSQGSDGRDQSEYRVLLMNEGDPSLILGEAMFRGRPPFTRPKPPLSKALVKRLIKSVANRLPFSGAPWILKDSVAESFGLSRPLPPVLQERIDSYRRRRQSNEEVPLPASEMDVDGEVEPVEDEISYPIDDAEVDAELKSPDSACPVSQPYPGPLAANGLLSHALQHWTFLRAFAGPILDLTPPFPFDDYVQALEYQEGESNPLLEAIVGSLLSFLARDRRNQSKSNFVEQLEEVLSSLQAGASTMTEEEMVDPVEVSDNVTKPRNSLEEIAKAKWFEASPSKTVSVWRLLLAFIADVCLLLTPSSPSVIGNNHLTPLRPIINYLLYDADFRKYGWRQFSEGVDLSSRVNILHLLINLAMRHRLVREHVDQQSEVAGEAKKVRRELEAERNRLQREADRIGEEVQRLQDAEEALRQEDASPSLAELRQASHDLRVKRNELNPLLKQLKALNRRIEAQAKIYRTAMAFRTLPLGEDRHARRYWWFDGPCTNANDLGQQGVGRLMVEDGQRWSFYDRVDQLEQLQAWLCPLGRREVFLKAVLQLQQERLQLFLKPAPSNDMEIDEPQQQQQQEEEKPQRKKRGATAASIAAAEGPAFLQYRPSSTR